ncbi:MAG: hypothetical protein CM15mP120_15780 [Pseudomonadota bacterium]|nr:MAG: hypothetical protein CM15mP120_15780 [Pseudomonadota bacterium]
MHTAPTRQFERFDQNLISDPLDWYRDASPWVILWLRLPRYWNFMGLSDARHASLPW